MMNIFRQRILDQRLKVTNRSYSPFNSIAKLSIKKNSLNIWATAFMIETDLAITSADNLNGLNKISDLCAHVLVDHQNNIYEKLQVQHFTISPKYLEGDLSYNYTIIYLLNPKKLNFNYVQIMAIDGIGLNHICYEQKIKINVCGFPSDLSDTLKNQEGKGKLDEQSIRYDIFADQGQKGGLVWVKLGGVFYAIGLHTQCKNDISRAFAFTPKRLEQIDKCIQYYCLTYKINRTQSVVPLTFEQTMMKQKIIKKINSMESEQLIQCKKEMVRIEHCYDLRACPKPLSEQQLQKFIIQQRCQIYAKPMDDDQDDFQLQSTPTKQKIDHTKPNDKSQLIKDTKVYPFRTNGLVVGQFSDGLLHGSGTLIAPKIVLTACHNVWRNGQLIRNAKFYPARDGITNMYGHFKAESIKIPQQKHNQNLSKIEKRRYDFALIFLTQECRLGLIKLQVLKEQDLKDNQFFIAGYPFNDDEMGLHYLWMSSGLIQQNQNTGLLSYTMKTRGGMSGSAICFKDQSGGYSVCGVHSGKTTSFNVGTRITEQIYLIIEQWINDFKQRKLFELRNKFPLHYILLNGYQIGDFGMRVLTKWELKGTKVMFLQNNGITEIGIRTLARIEMPELIQINLNSNCFKDRGLFQMRTCKWPKLTRMHLRSNQITSAGIKHLITMGMPELILLQLDNNKIDANGIIYIAQAQWHKMEQLNLENNMANNKPTQQAGAIKLWSKNINMIKCQANGYIFSTLLRLNVNLVELNLSNNNISFQEIQLPSSFPCLQNLNISNNKLTSKSFLMICSIQMKQLKFLRLHHNKIMKIVINSLPNWQHLISLDLNYNQISDIDGLSKIILDNLLYLQLSFNQIKDLTPLASASLPNLVTMQLNSNKINSIDPLRFVQWKKLKNLHLQYNEIDKICSFSGNNWSNLQYLDLSANKIVDLTSITSPNDQTQLSSRIYVKQLRVDHNKIIYLPQFSNQNWPNLGILDLSSNQLVDISSFTSSTAPIYSLYLNHNKIADVSFGNLAKLATLNLSSNSIVNIHPLSFSNLAKLSTLNLSTNKIINIIPLSFDNLTKLNTLNLSYNSIININPLIDSSLPSLKTLILDHNKIINISQLQPNNFPYLQQLNLSFNPILNINFLSGIKLQHLKQLYLCNSQINPENLDQFKSLNLPELHTLQLNYCKLHPQSLENLSTSQLPKLQNFTYLGIELSAISYYRFFYGINLIKKKSSININSLGFQDFGMDYIAKIKSEQLKSFQADLNSITFNGIKTLSDAHWPNLMRLSLRNNQIGSQGLVALCNRNRWPLLTQLFLDNNQIDERGLASLSSSKWNKMEYCSLQNNLIKAEGVYQIIKCEWPALKQLNLAKNYFTSENDKQQLKLLIRRWPNTKIMWRSVEEQDEEGVNRLRNSIKAIKKRKIAGAVKN